MCVTGSRAFAGEIQQTFTIAQSSVQYTYVKPSISLVFPKSGPMAGGTNVTIEGMFLNVGNGAKRLLLNGAMCVIL